jgi:hypothetical protein
MDADRLIQIAAELKTLDQRREGLLAEIGRIAAGIGVRGSAAPRRGRPPGSKNQASVVRRGPGRPSGFQNQTKPVASMRGGKRRSGITASIVEFLKNGGGGAYTAGEILDGLKLPKSKGLATTIGTTLVRLAKEGRAKKDKQRGYRAA